MYMTEGQGEKRPRYTKNNAFITYTILLAASKVNVKIYQRYETNYLRQPFAGIFPRPLFRSLWNPITLPHHKRKSIPTTDRPDGNTFIIKQALNNG